MEFLYIFAYLLLTLLTVAFYAVHKHYNYWQDRGVVYEKPSLLYGNMENVGKTKPHKQPINDFYEKHKGKAPFGGFYFSFRKAVLLMDLDLIKRVMITDFSDFSLRGKYYNEVDDPLSAHLFHLDGPKWKKMRSKLTPTFTSGKMKFMFPTVVEVGERFVKVLKEMQSKNIVHKKDGLEIRDLLARFTTDVIGTCAFGIECNSLKDPNAKFRKMGQKVFNDRPNSLLFAFAQAFPELARKLGICLNHRDVTSFFLNVVRETVEYRERENVKRNDFMNILIDLKNHKETEGLTLEEIAAQAFVFFLAGFETSSSAMAFAFYELALDQDMQQRVRDEINEVLKRHDNQLTYEAVKELKYLEKVFDGKKKKIF